MINVKIDICEEICLKALEEANIPIGKYVFKISPMRKYNGLCTSPARKGEPHEICMATNKKHFLSALYVIKKL